MEIFGIRRHQIYFPKNFETAPGTENVQVKDVDSAAINVHKEITENDNETIFVEDTKYVSQKF